MHGYIYAIKNTKNGRRYIGSSVRLRHRWTSHRSRLRKGAHWNKHLQSAWAKYGEANFVFEVIEEGDYQSERHLRNREKELFAVFAPNIYNFDPETRTNILNKPYTEEERAKISARFKEVKGTPEQRQLMRQRTKEYLSKPENLARFLEQMSAPDVIAKISGASAPTHKRWRSMHPEGVKVVSPNGDIYVVIEQKTFCETHNLHRSHFSALLQGKLSVHRGWRLYKEQV